MAASKGLWARICGQPSAKTYVIHLRGKFYSPQWPAIGAESASFKALAQLHIFIRVAKGNFATDPPYVSIWDTSALHVGWGHQNLFVHRNPLLEQREQGGGMGVALPTFLSHVKEFALGGVTQTIVSARSLVLATEYVQWTSAIRLVCDSRGKNRSFCQGSLERTTDRSFSPDV